MMILTMAVLMMALSVWANAGEWVYDKARNYKYRCTGDPPRCEVRTAETECYHKEKCYQRMQEAMRLADRHKFWRLYKEIDDYHAKVKWDVVMKECVEVRP